MSLRRIRDEKPNGAASDIQFHVKRVMKSYNAPEGERVISEPKRNISPRVFLGEPLPLAYNSLKGERTRSRSRDEMSRLKRPLPLLERRERVFDLKHKVSNLPSPDSSTLVSENLEEAEHKRKLVNEERLRFDREKLTVSEVYEEPEKFKVSEVHEGPVKLEESEIDEESPEKENNAKQQNKTKQQNLNEKLFIDDNYTATLRSISQQLEVITTTIESNRCHCKKTPWLHHVVLVLSILAFFLISYNLSD